MKTVAFGLVAFLGCLHCCGAGSVEKMYYLGEANRRQDHFRDGRDAQSHYAQNV